MKIQAAVTKEQGVTFVVVVVKRHIVQHAQQAKDAIQSFAHFFPQMPIVLMGQDSRSVPTYFGRQDIARFLSKIDYRRLPWKEFTFSSPA